LIVTKVKETCASLRETEIGKICPSREIDTVNYVMHGCNKREVAAMQEYVVNRPDEAAMERILQKNFDKIIA
jgi:hypothetical protein